MGTIVDATVPTEQFALQDTFEVVSDAEFESVRVVASEDGSVMPYLWGTAPDFDELGRALEGDATTRKVAGLGRDGDRYLYRIDWSARVPIVVDALVRERGTLLGARGRDDLWAFRILFSDHDSVSATYNCCQDRGIDIQIRRVLGVTESVGQAESALSEAQQEALVAAFETNYYDVPRELTQEELADELGVSHQALSERLRRGHRMLIQQTLSNATASVDTEESASSHD